MTGHYMELRHLLMQWWPGSVCLSVRPASRVRSVAPTVLVGSFSYSYILSSNFRRCVTCKGPSKFGNLNFGNFCNFDFVLFRLGIWCESLVWEIIGQRGVSQNAGVLVLVFFNQALASDQFNDVEQLFSPSTGEPEQHIFAHKLVQPTAGCRAIFHKYCCSIKHGGIITNG